MSLQSHIDENHDPDNIDLQAVIADSLSSIAQSQTNDNDAETTQNHNNEELHPNNDTQLPHNEDIDLENAINNAFDQFAMAAFNNENNDDDDNNNNNDNNIDNEINNNDNKNDNNDNNDINDNTPIRQQQSDQNKTDDDFNLDDAIGQAFDNVIEQQDNEEKLIQPNNDNNELNLDDAIDRAFESAIGDQSQSNETRVTDKPFVEIVEAVTEQDDKEIENQIEDDKLGDAIGKAFENVVQETSNNAQIQADSQHDLANDIGKAFESALNTSAKQPSELDRSKDDNDPDLDNAIGKAFENLMQQNKVSEPSEDDLNLDDAIGAAFKTVIQDQTQQNTNTNSTIAGAEPTNTDDTQPTKEVEIRHDQEELNLDEAIGNAFKNAFDNDSTTKPHPSEFESSHQLPPNDESNDDKDLHNAIGSAFSNILYNEDQSAQTEISNANSKPDSKQLVKHQPDSFDDDLNLDEAIGNAFKNLIPNQETTTSNTNATSVNEDTELENAIGDAFKSLNQNAPLPQKHDDTVVNEDELSSIIASSFQQVISGVEKKAKQPPNIPFDVTNLVQSLVNQMANQDDSTIIDHEKLPISEDILQELAAEITNQVQFHFSENDVSKTPSNNTTVAALPKIDDNVLAHFQQEAHKEVGTSKKHENINKVTTIPRPSFSNHTQKEKEGDLEQLQMNDILQNAFKMAMENPQDLLTDLDTEDITTREDPSIIEPESIPEPSPQSPPLPPQASSTARFLETLNRSTDIDLDGKKSDQTKKKTLSIAETLALHRSAMATGATSFINTDSSKGSPYDYGVLNSQISQALSSITSRINDGSSSNENLLNIIRQMTNSFTTGLQSSTSSTTSQNSLNANEIISSYSEKPEKDTIINSLLLAKKYLYDQSETPVPDASSNSLAATLLDKILNQFDSSKIDPSLSKAAVNTFSADRAPNIRNEFISSIGKSVVAAISNFSSNVSGRRSLTLDKPAVDSPEYKEKIRLENRERKKRWREENSDRNKDNDLRSRVLKRAAVMFGEQESAEKKAWADQEFNRRRDRRIAKEEKKEIDKSPTTSSTTPQDNLYVNGKETITKLSQDIELYKPVTDIFNIVSSATQTENPQASLAATAAATATVAAMYADRNQNVTYKQVESAVGSILTSLMESANSLGLNERLTSLSKGISASFQFNRSPSSSSSSSPSRFPNTELKIPNSSILNKISSNISDTSPLSYDSLSGFKNLNLQEKRKSDTGLVSEPKRPKVTLDTERDSFSKIASNLDQMRSSLSSGSWGSVNSLRMPSYRKSSDVTPAIAKSDQSPVKLEYSTLSLPTSSPFISNKIHAGIAAISSGVSSGLRRPGSFQKPTSKIDKTKAKSLGFPRLYSPST